MSDKSYIENQINNLLYEKLFSAIRKIIIQKQKDKFLDSTEYISCDKEYKKNLLNSHYKSWYETVSNFFLSYHSIQALYPLVQRELKIREFTSSEVIRIKADYIYNDIEFSTYYPTHYNHSMLKEVDDCINDLKNPKYSHIVDSYISKKDTERTPHEPLTTAELKYSAFYLFGYAPEYVTELANILYDANLITNPETNGWEIENSVVEDMITVLNKKYHEENVLQYKRTYVDRTVDRTRQECIRPVTISSDYFPKTIEKTFEFQNIVFSSPVQRTDALELYKFIYYITLSTQLKNSIYDTSVIEIQVGNKMLREQANEIIEGQENWELLTGKVITRISRNDDTAGKQTIVLPEIAPNKELKPLDVYSYTYHSKRPPRYGVGRFVTQILEKNAIGTNRDHDAILHNLIESKAVRQIKTMLHPQEASIVLIEWLREYMPSLLDPEYISELEEKINSAVAHEITTDSIFEEINRLIDAAFEASGYIHDDSRPSEAKKGLLRALALRHNLEIEDEVYESNVKIDLILAQYPSAEPIKVGSCPSCNSLVHQKEFTNKQNGEVVYYYACEKFGEHNGGCSFSLWDSYVHKYFSDKAIELFTLEERTETVKKILSKKRGYLFNGFIAKNKKPYDAKVYVESYEDKKTKKLKWGFQLKFVNTKK